MLPTLVLVCADPIGEVELEAFVRDAGGAIDRPGGALRGLVRDGEAVVSLGLDPDVTLAEDERAGAERELGAPARALVILDLGPSPASRALALALARRFTSRWRARLVDPDVAK